MRQFKSAGAFAAHLAGLAATMPLSEGSATRAAGELIQEEIRNSLGTYQDAAGPFAAWAPLSERTMEERQHRGLTPDDPLRATGELRDHIDMTFAGNHAVIGVTHGTVGDGSKQNPTRDIGQVAALMEFGSERVPPRSFVGRAAFVKGADAAKVAGLIVGAAIAGEPVSALPAAAILHGTPF